MLGGQVTCPDHAVYHQASLLNRLGRNVQHLTGVQLFCVAETVKGHQFLDGNAVSSRDPIQSIIWLNLVFLNGRRLRWHSDRIIYQQVKSLPGCH